MFQLTLVDHLRLTFGEVVHRYKGHVLNAERLARRVWRIRTLEAGLLSATAATAVAAVLADYRPFGLAAAALACLSLVTHAISAAADLDRRVYAHRWCGARLWLIREKYYALLSELRDGQIDLDKARERRDALMTELHAVYEHAPLVDRAAYQSARNALQRSDEITLSDEEIDRFLPESLRKAGGSAPVSVTHRAT